MIKNNIEKGDGFIRLYLKTIIINTERYSAVRDIAPAPTFVSPAVVGVGIVSRDREMQKIFELVRRISQVDINVLINGDTGTGKELIARAIHKNSKRKNGKYFRSKVGGIYFKRKIF